MEKEQRRTCTDALVGHVVPSTSTIAMAVLLDDD